MHKLLINLLREDELRGKRVFIRIDADADLLPTPMLVDPYKLRQSVPTLEYLVSAGARIIIGTHIGDPAGRPVDGLRVDPVARQLGLLMNKPVRKLNHFKGSEVERATSQIGNGEMLLLENLRFDPGEDLNDVQFAAELGQLFDVYCNDAFPLAHRGMASLVAITRYVRPAAAGMALARELMMFETLLNIPEPPFLGVIAGARLEEKLPILQNVSGRLNVLFIGGALSFTFMKAQGYQVGASPVAEEFVPIAEDFLKQAKGRLEVLLPEDFIVVRASDFRDYQDGVLNRIPDWRQVAADDIRPVDRAVDIGPKTVRRLIQQIQAAQTILWNGPVGVWQIKPFDAGTRQLAAALIDRSRGGFRGAAVCGDSLVRAIRTSGLPFERIPHLTSGGEPALQLLAGNPLAAVAALDDLTARMPPIGALVQRLLLVVNDSPGSLDTAARIGEFIDADRMEITVLHVQKPAVSLMKALWVNPDKVRRIDTERRFQAENTFLRVNAALARQGLISRRQLTVDGDPLEEILKAAGELQPALIAMPMSNVAQKLLNRSRFPLLIVGTGEEKLRKAG